MLMPQFAQQSELGTAAAISSRDSSSSTSRSAALRLRISGTASIESNLVRASNPSGLSTFLTSFCSESAAHPWTRESWSGQSFSEVAYTALANVHGYTRLVIEVCLRDHGAEAGCVSVAKVRGQRSSPALGQDRATATAVEGVAALAADGVVGHASGAPRA